VHARELLELVRRGVDAANLVHDAGHLQPGAYTRPIFSST